MQSFLLPAWSSKHIEERPSYLRGQIPSWRADLYIHRTFSDHIAAIDVLDEARVGNQLSAAPDDAPVHVSSFMPTPTKLRCPSRIVCCQNAGCGPRSAWRGTKPPGKNSVAPADPRRLRRGQR